MMNATLVNADVFIDGSGAAGLVRVGKNLFACSFAARTSVVRLVNNKAHTKSASPSAHEAALRCWLENVIAPMTPAYLARHAALCTNKPAENVFDITKSFRLVDALARQYMTCFPRSKWYISVKTAMGTYHRDLYRHVGARAAALFAA